MAAKTWSAQASCGVGVGVGVAVGDGVGLVEGLADGCATAVGPQPATATTMSRRMAASGRRCIPHATRACSIGLFAITQFERSVWVKRGRPPGQGGLGEGRESELDSEASDPADPR